MPSQTSAVPVPGGSLHAVVDGEGPPILLVHAGIVDLRAWDPLVPHLVEAGYRAVRYDIRGFGRSTTADVEFSQRADLRVVLDALGIDQAAFVGNSLGAMIGLDTILESPDRAISFVWVAGGIGGYEDTTAPERLEVLERRAAALAEAGDADALADFHVATWVDGLDQAPTRVPAWIRDSVREMDRPRHLPGRVHGRPMPLEPPANERLGEIRIPVLAVVGALDIGGTLDAAVRLEAAVEGATRVVIPGVAHMVGMEVPEHLARLILELVRPLGTWE
ncbi:MAG: hypothetical protein C0498_08910 [Anaerolinea sp.]|nr:hypothetical protein [Anaerolinea sp.]